MSYRKGDLQIESDNSIGNPARAQTDARDDGRRVLPGEAILDHSCDWWVIGGLQNMRWLVEDLQRVIEESK